MSREKAEYKGKKIELYDVDEDIKEVEADKKSQKKFVILMTFLGIIIAACVAVLGWAVYNIVVGVQQDAIVKEAEISVENETEVVLDYIVEDGMCILTATGTENKAYTVILYEVDSDNNLRARAAWSILFSEKEGWSKTMQCVVTENTQYVIKVKNSGM